ncbi:CBS domain containing-hemolysin-like protein [Vogesella perlucida]|nr:CBS domain containing-hemolysin-like protein [Vogesella perlucida]
MEFLMDPSIWIGLFTLVILEIVLGVDNLVFIAILADKLPPAQRDKARLIGLSLALIMRLALLSAISWMVTLTTPLFFVGSQGFSGRDLILILGGVFLLFKATMELHERLEGAEHETDGNRVYADFWVVVAQIVVLDAVFSLDAVITAVGMVGNLGVMMAAVVIAMAVMTLASKPLTRFVNAHPTVVVLCLSFLLMIGLSLVAEGFGFHIPKGYLYAAIGFSIMIEAFNQVARRNFRKSESHLPMRERTAEAILRMMGSRRRSKDAEAEEEAQNEVPDEMFGDEERYMISGVLTLADRSIRTIMTPRTEVSWVNYEDDPTLIRKQLLDTPHSLFPVCRNTLDEVIGVARAKDLLAVLDSGESLLTYAAQYPAIVVPESMGVIKLLGVLRRAKGRVVLVTDEFGAVQGLVTPLDVLEAIAGEFPDEDETPDIVQDKGGWLVKGGADLRMLEQALGGVELVSPAEDYASLAGLLLGYIGHMPTIGEHIDLETYRFEVLEVTDRKIDLVYIYPIPGNIPQSE